MARRSNGRAKLRLSRGAAVNKERSDGVVGIGEVESKLGREEIKIQAASRLGRSLALPFGQGAS
jgi:hypothetical protein